MHFFVNTKSTSQSMITDIRSLSKNVILILCTSMKLNLTESQMLILSFSLILVQSCQKRGIFASRITLAVSYTITDLKNVFWYLILVELHSDIVYLSTSSCPSQLKTKSFENFIESRSIFFYPIKKLVSFSILIKSDAIDNTCNWSLMM